MKRLFTVQMLSFLSIVWLLVGCAGKPKPVESASQATLQTRSLQPSPGKALVYYYNDKLFVASTSVSLDKMPSENDKGTYVVWEVDPGKHYLEFSRKVLSSHKFGLNITCEADRIYYFYLRSVMQWDLDIDTFDRETYEIVQADDQTGRANIEKLALAGWFKDGVLVASAKSEKETQAPVTEAERQTGQPESKPEEQQPTAKQEERLTIPGRYYALIIGIEQYQYWDRLATAVNDARSVAKLLQESYGFQVQTLLDQQATREAILDTFHVLRNTLQPEDKLLIYYAGHCTLETETQTVYWLPVEAKRDSDTQWISAETVTKELKRLPANQVCVVVDSCYAGMLARTSQPDLSSEAKRRSYLQEIATQRARVLMTSGSHNPTADQAGAEHSIFAQAFIEALTKMEPTVFTAEEVFAGSIREAVAGVSKQIPEFGIIRDSGHQGGDFIFQKQPAP